MASFDLLNQQQALIPANSMQYMWYVENVTFPVKIR